MNLPPQTQGIYRKGDFIGQKYEVCGVLGKGGFGIVYLVYTPDSGKFFALKTFLDEFLADREIRNRFHKEASVWVELGSHPFLVRANFVEEISGRLYIGMDYVAPNQEGLNSLEGYLHRRPPDLLQSLRWAIQICLGMEYACSMGVRAHRDLKPANIMIDQKKTAMVTDFGLAMIAADQHENHVGNMDPRMLIPDVLGHTIAGVGFGTPTHMAPEQFDNAAGCDERSDIYSFGVILYQMAAGRLPFFAPVQDDFWQAMSRLHHEAGVPRLDSPLFAIIQQCLEKLPEKRYRTFQDVHRDLASLLQNRYGEEITPPPLAEREAWEWINKAYCHSNLEQHQAALDCCDQALARNPCIALAWNNKGCTLLHLNRHQDALGCFNKAIELDPGDASVWANKSNCLDSLGHNEGAICCLDKALELDPYNAGIIYNKGVRLISLSRYEESISFFDRALKLDSQHVNAWVDRGTCLDRLGRFDEAIQSYDNALKLDPFKKEAWLNKGINYLSQKNYLNGLVSFNKALEIDPRYAPAWTRKAKTLDELKHYDEAVRCYDKALQFDPQDAFAWIGKGMTEDQLDHMPEAAQCYKQFLLLATAEYDNLIEFARQRVRELGK
jgi:tetratricopeptide (TPR) repeat protein